MNSFSATRNLERMAEESESTGDYERAEEYLRQCIAMRRIMSADGDRGHWLIDPLYNLGLVCWAQDKEFEAIISLEEAYELSCDIFGAADSDSQDIKQVLCMIRSRSQAESSCFQSVYPGFSAAAC